jgi:hypothetical protein
MSADLVIPESAFPYLVAQRGALDDMRGDRALWCRRYLEILDSEMRLIEPYLPTTCDSILDVGGGMGGIDILLSRHFGGCHVTILDGLSDPPMMQKHAETFSNMGAAADFLKVNGVASFDFLDANTPKKSPSRAYDLVVSFKSWCFHIEPPRYLDFVVGSIIPGQTKLIIDVRRHPQHLEAEYMRALMQEFRHIGCIFRGIKFETHWFEAK